MDLQIGNCVNWYTRFNGQISCFREPIGLPIYSYLSLEAPTMLIMLLGPILTSYKRLYTGPLLVQMNSVLRG